MPDNKPFTIHTPREGHSELSQDELTAMLGANREKKTMDYAKLALQVYAQNKAVGWWDDPNRCIYQTLQLVSTELAEATEGERKDRMDDKLPHRKMAEVELADALTRLLDLGGRYGWRFLPAGADVHPLVRECHSAGGQHFACNLALCELGQSLLNQPSLGRDAAYTRTVLTIVYAAEQQGYDIEGALHEKLECNIPGSYNRWAITRTGG